MKFVAKALSAVAAALFAGPGFAQDFPSRPMRLIMPFAAGSTFEVAVRLIASKMEPQLKQPVIVENKPGANALIGATFVARQPADGYTLLFANPMGISKVNFKDPGFDVRVDFVPVSAVCSSSYVLAINSAVPARTLKEFVIYVKANPGKVNYANSANTTLLSMELFKAAAGLDMVGVPYKGAAPGTQALVAGEVQAIFGQLNTFKSLEDAGKVRILASAFGRRLSKWPDIPTFAESGYGDMEFALTTAILARREVPRAILDRLSAVLRTAVVAPDVAKVCIDGGGEPIVADIDTLQRTIGGEIDQWAVAAARAKFVPQD